MNEHVIKTKGRSARPGITPAPYLDSHYQVVTGDHERINGTQSRHLRPIDP